MSSAFPIPDLWTWSQPSMVTITSIETETVHPTWIYTLMQVISSTEILSTQSLMPAMVIVTASIHFSTGTAPMTSTILSETTTLALESTTAPTTMENLPSPTTVGSQYLTTSSPSTSRYRPEITSSAISSPSGSTINPTSSPSTSTSTSTSTPATPFIGIATSASISSASTHPTKTGLIVGTILGGTALIFMLLGVFLCIRRNRKDQSKDIKQRLLRGDSISPTHHSSTPMSSPNLPSPPPPPRPNYTNNLPPAYSNPDLSLDSMYLRRDGANPDPDIHPPSPVEISSRMTSFRSTSSTEGGLGIQDSWDLERGEHSKHDSMRSNPFDLEPPPSVYRSNDTLPATRGVKF